jgi:RNA polymerase sigma-70 factor, ECF subfamily
MTMRTSAGQTEAIELPVAAMTSKRPATWDKPKARLPETMLPLPSPKAAARALEQVLKPAIEKRSTASRSAASRRARKSAFDAATDVELLDAVCRGDEVAWESFYDRFRNLMVACVTRVCLRAGIKLQADDLMDILGDTCMNMVAGNFRRLRLYRTDGGCSVSSWIGVIATSTAHDFLRRERRRRIDPTLEADLERLAPLVDGPDAALIDRQQRAFVDIALSGLSKRDRKFAELYFGEAKSPEDIAKEMGVSVSTVYSKKAKIKTRLRSLASSAAA